MKNNIAIVVPLLIIVIGRNKGKILFYDRTLNRIGKCTVLCAVHASVLG